jgi:hypothetical protein
MAREQQFRGRGRFQGQRSGQRGRGGGGRRAQGSNTRTYTTTVNQTELKFAPHVQGKHQTTYSTVKDAIIQYIQKTFKDGDDVAQSLKEGKLIDLEAEKPVRGVSSSPVKSEATLEQTGLDILYQEELRGFFDRKNNLRTNMTKAYALIFTNYCNRTMQLRIEEHPEFETKIENKPIALLEAIKVLMHDPVRATYPMVSMTEALTRLVNLKQNENEQLLDYVKRFKQQRDVVKSYLGTKLLDTFVEQSEEYRNITAAQKATSTMKEEAFNAWMAYLLIRGCDQSKYGSLTKGFILQYSLGNDQYPKTIQVATDVLSNHKLDAKFYENRKKNFERPGKQQDGETPGATSFAQQKKKDVVCYICGEPGHTKP